MKEKQTNNLFPVFLKLEHKAVLIVGAGKVGLEKLQAILLNAPSTTINLVGLKISSEIRDLAQTHSQIHISERVFLPSDLDGIDLVMIAINDPVESERIRKMAVQNGKWVNAADKPELCDFYMGSIVQKGNLKIAISTNGKSPTIAKRLKETLSELLPPELDEVLDHMEKIRSRLKGDFASKVQRLNELTRDLAKEGPAEI
ncbi:MAG: bifunctional precorrin-2 dehydrogenase/sirohydrochlorin ferrochelatase [Flavisolibacter sp.]